jgi:hypothetical protein
MYSSTLSLNKALDTVEQGMQCLGHLTPVYDPTPIVLEGRRAHGRCGWMQKILPPTGI